jgi:hypothetical protein
VRFPGLLNAVVVVCTAGLGASLIDSGCEDRIVPIGRNMFRCPQAKNPDLRFTKRMRFSDRYSMELTGEAFNARNHRNVTDIRTIGCRLSNNKRHANMARLIRQSGEKPGPPSISSTCGNTEYFPLRSTRPRRAAERPIPTAGCLTVNGKYRPESGCPFQYRSLPQFQTGFSTGRGKFRVCPSRDSCSN